MWYKKTIEEVKKELDITVVFLPGIIAIAVCVLIFVIAYFQKKDLFEMFLTAISLIKQQHKQQKGCSNGI